MLEIKNLHAKAGSSEILRGVDLRAGGASMAFFAMYARLKDGRHRKRLDVCASRVVSLEGSGG